MLAVGASVLALQACASTTRLMSYGDAGLGAHARITVQGKPMNIMMHPREQAMAVQVTAGEALATGTITGLTYGLVKGFRPDPRNIDRAMQDFVRPSGCTIQPVRMVGNEGVSFETFYSCPAGVDLRAIVRSQTPDLMRGEPIRMP
jgi:hypothetical protein